KLDAFENADRAHQAYMLGRIPADLIEGIATMGVGAAAGAALRASSLIDAVGFWGRGAAAESGLINYAARDAANATRLNAYLALQQGNILDDSGLLTEFALQNANSALKFGTILRNPYVVSELTKNGGDILEWEKLKTPSIELSTGQSIQVHFYKNSVTNEVNYTLPDFKVKGQVDIFPRRPLQEPTVKPPYFNP
ncbi:MAG: hypothetical protein WBE18_05395, partial [Gammaproteobacteria bacterium]